MPRRDLGLFRRLATMALLGLLVAAGCVQAGRWQWGRYVTRSHAAHVIEANYDAPPTTLTDLLPGPGAEVTDALLWHPATVRGRYLPERTVLLRNRPVQGQAGFQVLVPFEVTEATEDAAGDARATPRVLIVNRGWVPTSEVGATPGTVPAPPVGTVELVVRLRAEEPSADRTAPTGQTYQICRADILTAVTSGSSPPDPAWSAETLFPAYGILVHEDPAPSEPIGTIPAPDTSTGPHLSYAFQWWVFAVIALVGSGLLIQRDLFDARAGAVDTLGTRARPEGPAESTAAPPRRRARRPSAEEEEDALVEAQLRERSGT